MAKEPYVESNIYDLTGNLAAAPSDDGYPIIGAVFSPTGPIEKRKVLSQKDFIDNYLLSSTVLPTDDDSIKFLFKVLEINPVYVVRACPVTVLEGITSKGRSLLFDKSYNLLPEYFKFKIESIKDTLSYYYLIVNDSYILATGSASASEIAADANERYGLSLSSDKVTFLNDDGEQNPEKSLDKLLSRIVPYFNKKSASSPTDFISSSEGYLQSRVRITGWSSNVGLHKEIIEQNKYNSITSDDTLLAIPERSYINIDGTSYYFSGTNGSLPTGLTYPVKIKSPDSQATILSKFFLLKVIGTSNCDSYGTLEFGLKDINSGEESGSAKDVTFIETNIDSLKISDDQESLLLVTNSKLSVDSLKYLTISMDGGETTYTFTLGLDTASNTATNTRISLGSGNSTTYKFISNFLDYVISNFSENFDSADVNSLVFNEDKNITILNKAANVLSSDTYSVLPDMDESTDRNLVTYQYYTSTDKNNKDYIKFDYLYFTVGDYYYYTGSSSKNPPSDKKEVPMSSDAVTYSEFISLLQYNLFVTQEIGMFNDSFIDTNGLTKDDLDYDSESFKVITDKIYQSTVEQFAIVQKFPSKSSILRFSYKKSLEDSKILDLTLNFKNGTSTEDWTMSFVPGVTDGYGIDQWYDRVENDYFKVVSLTDEGELGELADEVEAGKTYTSPYFGGSVGVPDFNVQYMINAMESVPEYDDDQYYYMVTDSGIINTSYSTVLQKLCQELKAWYPVSLPSSTNIADLIDSVAGLSSYFVRALAASDRESISGFSSVFPGSLKLIRSVLNLYRNQSMEFAPNYDLNNGTVGTYNLVQKFTKTEREKLLDYKIETLKGGVGSPYYINDNLTMQPKKTYLSENQNVLMTIVAIHECESVARYFKAELNTPATRKRFQDALNSAIQDRLFKGKAYAPYSYYAVSDETNNPLNVINDNKLVASLYAQFTPSAKKVILDHFIVPLQQA